MQSRFIARIAELLKEFETTPLDRGFIAEFMIEVRQLLEDTGAKATFQRLNLYCNWYAHAELSESTMIFDALKHGSGIVEAILKGSADPQNVGAYWELSLGLDLLRFELIALLNTAGLPARIFENDQKWGQFIGLLLKKLEGKPLRLPNGHNQAPTDKDKPILKKAKRAFNDALQTNNGNINATFVAIEIILEKDPWDPRPEILVEPTFHFKVTNVARYSFVTKMPTSIVPR